MNEWESEPNDKKWTDEETGFECLIWRTPGPGHLCGYINVPTGHPWHGEDYDAIYDMTENGINVHGGLTFAGDRKREGEWWVGFDCAHLYDLSPLSPYQDSGSTYRNMAYVTAEVAKLARQADAAVGGER